jgi:microcystin-dependent protein
MPSTSQLTQNSRSMNGLNTINANAVFTDTLEVNNIQIDIQGTAPTRGLGDNTTNIATTQFVQSAVSGAGAGYVDLTSTQTISGEKTFSNTQTLVTGVLRNANLNPSTGGTNTFRDSSQTSGSCNIATNAGRSGAININTGATATAPVNISSLTTNNAPITIGSTASTTQTCAMNGITTFSKIPSCAVAPTSADHLCNKTYVDSVGVSLAGNNIFTGFNQFRQETGVFNGSGLSVSLDVYNPGLSITTSGGGTTGQSNSGFTMFPQRLVVPAGNKSRTAYISVPIDICSSSGTAYTGNMTLNFLSVTTNTLRNGASYSGSTTGKAYLTNYTAFSKTWTGFASQVPTAKCYLGDVLIAIPLIVDNVTTDNYDVGIILTGSGAPPGAGIVFVTSWNTGISFTATNTQPSGVVFTGVNPLYLGVANIVSTNKIVSTDNLDIATSTNDLTITADGSLELNANNGFWTANSVMSENFYFRARLTPNIVLQNIRGVDLLNIQGSSSNILFQTQSNIPLQIDSGTGNINITTTGNLNLPLTGTVNLIPAGTITQGLYTSLAGYLLCDGTSYSTTTYAKLFAVIGYNYGGSGASFNVPDFRGMFLRGNGSQTIGGVTYTGGSLSLAGRQQDQAMSATSATNQGFRSCAAGTRDAVARFAIGTDPVDTGTGILAQFPRQGVETRPANYTVNYFVRY